MAVRARIAGALAPRSPRAAATTTDDKAATPGEDRRQGSPADRRNCPSWTARSWRSRPSGRARSRRTSRRSWRSSRSAPAPRSPSCPAQDPIVNFLGTKIAGGSRRTWRCCRRSARSSRSPTRAGPSRSAPRPRRSSTKNYSQGWQDLGAVDGKQYGVYFKAANKSLIWYNTAAFENAGAQRARRPGRTSCRRPQTLSDSGVTAGLGRRRGRLDAHRLVRERLPLPGGPGEVRPARQARDQVDRPVREGRR